MNNTQSTFKTCKDYDDSLKVYQEYKQLRAKLGKPRAFGDLDGIRRDLLGRDFLELESLDCLKADHLHPAKPHPKPYLPY